MKVESTPLQDCFVIEPQVFGDQRGFFMESFNYKKFSEATGFKGEFVQDNHSRSKKGVLRGMHYQMQNTQGKLVRVSEGAVYDVAVDLRKSSPSFGKSFGLILSAENKKQLWVPAGFAHGFLVITETADFLYKTTDYYAPQFEKSLLWNDPALGIQWPTEGLEVLLSEKDKVGLPLAQCEVFG